MNLNPLDLWVTGHIGVTEEMWRHCSFENGIFKAIFENVSTIFFPTTTNHDRSCSISVSSECRYKNIQEAVA